MNHFHSAASRLRYYSRFSYVLFFATLGFFFFQIPNSSFAESNKAIPQKDAFIAPLADKSLLLDVTRAGEYWITVGEWGHILYSKNSKDWVQASTPTQNTLTAVYFLNDKQGWAIGHDSVILYSGDGGKHWELQFSAPELEMPLFGILFLDAQHGIAVGAYGLYLTTSNGGKTWNQSEIEPGMDRHMNDILSIGNDIFVIGETGVVFRSENRGESWASIEFPYTGSLFGASVVNDDQLIVFGLRGTIYLSVDRGSSWRKIESNVINTLMDHVELKDGTSVIIGLGGTILSRSRQQQEYSLQPYSGFNNLVAVSFTEANEILLFGERGIQTFQLTH